MPGFNPDNINIHDLTVEEPEKESNLAFDVERDITTETWKAMDRELRVFKQDKDWYKFLWLGARMKALKPDIDIHFDEETSQLLTEELKRCWKEDNVDYFSDEACNMKVIDPQMDISPVKEVWGKMTATLKHYKTDITQWRKFIEQAMRMKVIDPQTDIQRDEDIEDFGRDVVQKSRTRSEWFWFSKEAMEVKILDPKADLKISQKEWAEMKKYLNNFLLAEHHVSWWNFSTMAMAMKILAAEEVKVTDEGLEINMKKPNLSSESPELPEQRKF